MSRYVIARRAQRDLLHIRNWIETDNPSRAVSYVEEMITQFGRLAAMPLMGRNRDDLGRGIRSLVHGNFLVFYRVEPDRIVIVHVVHTKRDWSGGFR